MKAIERGGQRLPSVAALLELIVEHVASAVDRLADKLSAELDKIEEGLCRGVGGDFRQELGRSRRTGVRLHRQLSGLRSLFHRMERDESEHVNPRLQIAAGKIAQRLDALDHDVVEIRDRARLLQDEVGVATAEESNRALRLLTILTTLILPPTLVAGAFGMNLKGIPFAEDAYGFWWGAAVMFGSMAAVYLLIRWIGALRA